MSDRVLVARLDSAGDVLLAGPAVWAVAASGARVTLLCSSRGEPAARLLPGVAEVLVFDAPWVHGTAPAVSARALARLLWHIRRRSFSDSLILTSNFQSPLPLAMVLQLAGVPRVVGVSDDYPGSLLDLRLFIDRDLHEAERGLAIAEGAGYRGDGPELRVLPDLPCVRWPGRADPFVVVHPGADAPARQWPPESAQRAVELLAVAGFQVVVTGSSQERALTRTVAGERGIDLGGATTLAELAGVLRDCRAVVVGNTGPAHLAAAVGTPIVSLFAPVVPAHKWAPYAGRVRVLGDQGAACADTRARECPIPGHPCLGSVTADEVATAVKALVGAAA